MRKIIRRWVHDFPAILSTRADTKYERKGEVG
jgi:hypothetical protein